MRRCSAKDHDAVAVVVAAQDASTTPDVLERDLLFSSWRIVCRREEQNSSILWQSYCQLSEIQAQLTILPQFDRILEANWPFWS